MTKNTARKLARKALANVAVNEPETVADTTVLFKNEDGTYSVTDNGEEVVCKSVAEAERIIVENLAA